MTKQYHQCVRCVMDTTDPAITFDKNGMCNHCHRFDESIKPNWFPNEEGKRRLESIIARIQAEGRHNDYDCIIGLSGGVDSSYLALKAKGWGLRPLLVHVDAGWNYEVAVQNIEKIAQYCGFDLFTHVMNWEDMKNLQLAFLRSGVANQDVPQDHAFFSQLYHFATANRIRYVLSGGNIATEAIFPQSWQHSAMDGKNLLAILNRFGNGYKLQEYRVMKYWKYYFYYPYIKKMRVIRPLNFMPYTKEDAISELQNSTGWRPYGRKHGESVFTRFFQNYYIVQRFGYDKRKPHLSSMILSGQLAREEAIDILAEPLYDNRELEEDILYFRKKLGISEQEFSELLHAPLRRAEEFPNDSGFHRVISKTRRLVEFLLRRRIAGYS